MKFQSAPDGSKHVAKNGYVLVKITGHPRGRKGWVYEHIAVASEKIGRQICGDEHVHHLDGNKQNNAAENLEVMSASEHHRLHRRLEAKHRAVKPNPLLECRCGCGDLVAEFDSRGRPRLGFVHGHNGKRLPTRSANAIAS